MSGVSVGSRLGAGPSNSSITNSQTIGDVDDEMMMYFHICFNITLRMIISVVGVVANFVSAVIFSKLGLKDSMSVELFCLSITDFVVEVIQVGSCIFYIINFVYPSMAPKAWLLCYIIFGWAGNTALSISSWITAVISLERCLCVVFPFKAKQMFTRCRCVIVIMFIQLVHIILGLPYILDKVRWVDSSMSSTNNNNFCETVGSNCTAMANPGSSTFNTIIDLIVGVAVSVLLQFVVIASTIWMGYSLQLSSRVRQMSPNVKPQVTIRLLSINLTETLSNRERRLVKVVMSLAIILTICNAPQVIAAIAYHAVPDLNSEQQKNTGTILWTVTYTFGSLGCSSNFLVYLRLNRNYRRLLRQWFGLCQATS